MLERRCQEDEVKYGCVTLMLDAMSIKKTRSTWSSDTNNVWICGHGGSIEWDRHSFRGSCVYGGWASRLLDQVPHTRITESVSRTCIRRAASSSDKGGVHDNGWSCIKCQYVLPTWVRSKSRPLWALEDPFPTSSNPWQCFCYDGRLPHAEADTQYVAGTCSFLAVLLFIHFYCIYIIVQTMVLYSWRVQWEKKSDSAGIQPN